MRDLSLAAVTCLLCLSVSLREKCKGELLFEKGFLRAWKYTLQFGTGINSDIFAQELFAALH